MAPINDDDDNNDTAHEDETEEEEEWPAPRRRGRVDICRRVRSGDCSWRPGQQQSQRRTPETAQTAQTFGEQQQQQRSHFLFSRQRPTGRILVVSLVCR
jgi:hypothetical protein